jgi:hypothetical protein
LLALCPNAGSIGDPYAALRAISDAWVGAQAADPDLADPGEDVIDLSADKLTGSAGRDWFIIGAGDTITDWKAKNPDGDVVTHL